MLALSNFVQSQFKFEAEVDMSLTMKEQKLLFDGSLSNSLIISYNAKAVDGQLCLEASPTEGHSSVFAHSPHATLLEGVEPVLTTSIHSALHSLGGIQVSPLHLSGDLLSVIFDFLRYLSKSPYSEELIQPLVVQLLFNASLWIRASKKCSSIEIIISY
ncbi:PREDICTED: neurobeachin-like [Amphimedon queenslandica]|uniref:DUF4704 domain-containing protein n=2 Tax=Amphimedon queenslandica TaxID=400682 RepID=A0AAN0JXS5_AMPQE|nr:PREDICTED: neurobeachin-like [Amphimedon queenslandica]|eukprot:XP_019861756.1 PREDICTED: neurobeachin-like [Amphimedon queenslandica]